MPPNPAAPRSPLPPYAVNLVRWRVYCLCQPDLGSGGGEDDGGLVSSTRCIGRDISSPRFNCCLHQGVPGKLLRQHKAVVLRAGAEAALDGADDRRIVAICPSMQIHSHASQSCHLQAIIPHPQCGRERIADTRFAGVIAGVAFCHAKRQSGSLG